MRKSLAAVAICLLTATAISASLSPALAMPAPEPGNSELSAGLLQWGAETESPREASSEENFPSQVEKSRTTSAAPSKKAMCETLAAAAEVHDLPVGFFVRLINQESGFNPQIVSSAGAQGVAQFMPKVAEEWGLKNPFDPHAALVASARFLRSLYNQFGNWGLAAAAYNGGMGRIQKWIDKRGKLPDETRHYVKTITGIPAEEWAQRRSMTAKYSIPPRAPCQEIAHLADKPSETVRVAVEQPVRVQIAGGPPRKTGSAPTVTVRRGMQVAVIKVKGVASKVAAVAGKIAAPKSIVADAAPADRKAGQKTAPIKLAQKTAPKAAKTKDTAKPAKGRVQLADARGARGKGAGRPGAGG